MRAIETIDRDIATVIKQAAQINTKITLLKAERAEALAKILSTKA